MDSNQSGAVGGIIWGPFQGSWAHLGASRGLRSQKRGPFGAIFWPSLPPPANPVKFFWSKMACTSVPHIVLYVLCTTRTPGGYSRPSEVRFRALFAVSGDLFYKAKTHILQKGPFPPTDLAENLCMDSQTPPGSKSKSWHMGNSGPKNIV